MAVLLIAEHDNASIKDATHIAMLGGPPNVFIANPKTGIKTLDDWIRFVKASPKPAGSTGPHRRDTDHHER